MNRIIVIFIFLNVSCKSFEIQDYKSFSVLKYIAAIAKFDYAEEKVFLIEIPKNGKLNKKISENHVTDVEYRITYPDSSILYITNSYFYDGELNLKNRIHSGIKNYHRENPFDTLSVQDVQENGLLWKEHILGDIAVVISMLEKKIKFYLIEVLIR